MIRQFSYILSFAAIAITGTLAGPVPITPGQLSPPALTVTATVSGADAHLVCPGDVNGCGGAFSEAIGPISNATIWCVDSQLEVTDGETYTAYIESLNNSAASFDNGNIVRYGGISASGGGAGQWSYDLSGYGLSSPDNALTRYELAALLISQYVPNAGMPTDTTQNRSIQDAIWHLTENGVAGNLNSLAPVAGVTIPSVCGSGSGACADWISYAAHTLTTMSNASSFFSGWAVVSGGYDVAGGHLLNGTGAVQTFLVQVTPEPRFYGVLLAGLLILAGMMYRRRVAS